MSAFGYGMLACAIGSAIIGVSEILRGLGAF